VDDFIPFSHRSIQDHALGRAVSSRNQVARSPGGDLPLADLQSSARLATAFPGFGVTVGGSCLSPRAQPWDCPTGPADRTPLELLMARHRFVRRELRGSASWPLLRYYCTSIADAAPPVSPREPEPWRLAVEQAIADAKAALRKLSEAEEALGEAGLVSDMADFVDPSYDELLKSVDQILAPVRKSSMVSDDFEVRWDTLESKLYVQVYTRQGRPKDRIDVQSPRVREADPQAAPRPILERN